MISNGTSKSSGKKNPFVHPVMAEKKLWQPPYIFMKLCAPLESVQTCKCICSIIANIGTWEIGNILEPGGVPGCVFIAYFVYFICSW